MSSPRDKSVLITGAAAGIGAALADRFARAGWRLGLLDRDEGAVIERAERLREAGAEVVARVCDVTQLDQCMSSIEAVLRAHDGVDVLVNNAGITHVGLFQDTEVDVVRRVMDVNFFGSVNCTKVALPSLLARRGQIVVLSSVAGLAPLATRTGYAASKHALHGFFESLRVEHAKEGLAVTMVCPSFVHTGIGDRALAGDGSLADPGARSGVRGAIPPEVAAAAIFDAVEKRRRLLLVPRRARLFHWIWELAPTVYERMMARRTMS